MAEPDIAAGRILTAATLREFGDQRDWTPTLTASTTNPTLGTGSVAWGKYLYASGFAVVHFNVTFGTSGAAAGTGAYQLDLPADLTIDANVAANVAVGVAELNDSGTPYPLMLRTSTSTRLIFRHAGDATHGNSAWASTTVAPGNNDFVRGTFSVLLA